MEDSFEFAIRKKYNELRSSEKRVADIVLENYMSFEHMTIMKLAELAGVSQPTIIRFAGEMGLKGFKELKFKVLQEYEIKMKKKNKMVPLLGYELSTEDQVREIPAKIVSNTIARLENSLKYLSLYEFNNAVEAIKAAETITLFGMENSYAIASDLAAKLTYIGFKCNIHPDPFMQEVSAKNLSSKDVAIAFSYTGNSISTVRALQNARAMGATTIAITSNEKAGLVKFADILLCFSGKQYLYGNVIFSRTSQLAICDMLYAGVFVSDFDKYKKKLDDSSVITDYMMYHE